EEEDRTPDLCIANAALSQLSYPPTTDGIRQPCGPPDRQSAIICGKSGRSIRAWSHQQVLARIVAAQDDVVHLADIHQALAARVADRALHVFFHLAQRVGQPALDGLEDALAFDVLVLAFVEVAGRAVILLVQLAIDLHRLAGTFLVARQHRANHDHGGAEADRLGDVAVLANAAVGNDGLGRHARAPLERRQLPAAGTKAGLELGDADLAGTDADLGGVRAPVLEVDDGLGRAHVARDHEGRRQLVL